jgi:signal transduction histidine kinase
MAFRPFRGLTIRAALILGFGLTLSLWLLTGYQAARRTAELEQQSTDIATRYVQAQDALAALRRHVLATSGAVRDALLNSERPQAAYHDQVADQLKSIEAIVASYVLVLDSTQEHVGLDELRRESTYFAGAMRSVLLTPDPTSNPRVLFGQTVLPAREALLRCSEELQAINRAVFIRDQHHLDARNSAAERRTWQQLGLALLVGLAIAIAAIFYAGRLEARLKAELEKDARNTQALQRLSTRLITIQEDERQRIARELHDEVGQALTAIKLEVVVAQRRMDPSVSGILEPVQQITDQTLQTVRNLSRLLHPAALDDLGLQAAIDCYVGDFTRRTGIRTTLLPTPVSARLPPDIERAAYRIVQEALTNVARHADATSCSVTVQRQGRFLEVVIEDDGQGFDTNDLECSPRRGLGLLSVSERVADLNGVVSIASEVGHGTRLCVSLPASSGRTEAEDAIIPDDSTVVREPARG